MTGRKLAADLPDPKIDIEDPAAVIGEQAGGGVWMVGSRWRGVDGWEQVAGCGWLGGSLGH